MVTDMTDVHLFAYNGKIIMKNTENIEKLHRDYNNKKVTEKRLAL